MVSARSDSPAPDSWAQQIVLDYLRPFGPLSPDEARAITAGLHVRLFPKGVHLLREGQVSDLCYFVLKGCVREYCLKDGLDKTVQIYTEGQPIAQSDGATQRKGAAHYLVCMEDCALSVGGPEDEARLFAHYPHLERLCRLAVESELAKTHRRLSLHITGSPEERYRRLLDERPDLFERVPLYHIASYIGVTPESLSRIRRRVARRG